MPAPNPANYRQRSSELTGGLPFRRPWRPLRGWASPLIRAVPQNISLVCTKLDIGGCPVGGFVNDTLVKIIDLTEHEIPIYVYGMGKGA